MDRFAGWAAAAISIVAGLYLLLTDSAAEDATVFDALMHGIGAYFIARGLWMISSLLRGRSNPGVVHPESARPSAAATIERTAPE